MEYYWSVCDYVLETFRSYPDCSADDMIKAWLVVNSVVSNRL